MRDFIIALGFLTRIPVGGRLQPDAVDMARSSAYFPLVGLVIGGILVLADLAGRQVWPGPVVNGVLLAVLAGITGGIHLDGFMDTADGIWSGSSREKMLQIMRDSRTGAMGVMAVVVLLLIQWAALAALPYRIRHQGLLAMTLLSRWAMVYALCRYPYAREGEGTGKAFVEHGGNRELAVASAITVAAAIVLFQAGGLAVLVIVAGFTVAMAGYVAARLGGMTGDALGATNEAVEAFSLLVMLALAGRGII